MKSILMFRNVLTDYPRLLMGLFLVCSSSVFSQNLNGHNWYFGSSPLGIQFNRVDNSPSLLTNKTLPFGTGGSAVANDRLNGNLLFYTDGERIYNASHQMMTGGDPLLSPGNPNANQPVAIARVPGPNPNQYYVFTNTAIGNTPGSISYRIVDMTLAGNSTFGAPPLGEVVAGSEVTLPYTPRSEGMIVIPHQDGDSFWLITHESGVNTLTAELFSASLPPAVINSTGGFIEHASNLSFHPGTGQIAVAPHESQRNVEVFSFDNTTGTFGTITQVPNSAIPSTPPNTLNAIYDTEWSSNGKFLYISYTGETTPADVKQFQVGTAQTLQTVLPSPAARSYGLQMGPDSVMYHVYQATPGGDFLVGVFTDTDSVFSDVQYNPIAFATNPNFDGMQFPSFAPPDTVGINLSFTSSGECMNAPVNFYPEVSPQADSLLWDFGDGNGSNAWSPVHTYESAGSFTVQLIAFVGGTASQPVTNNVNITQFDLQIQLVQDTTACICEYKPPVGNSCNGGPFSVKAKAQNDNGAQYQWFGPSGLLAGQNTLTLVPDSAGYYYIVGTIGNCSAYAGVNIKTYDSLDQRANIWYFGQNAGIDFNGLPDNPPVAIQGPLNTPEGTSVISDRNGQVIFSTDGLRIYDKENNEITQTGTVPPLPINIPPGLGGDPDATQSALIIPVPGDETLFYIFTTLPIYGAGDAKFELRYSVFDLKLNNGIGGVAEFNQLLFAPSTERITSNGNWLIAHEYGNNSFRAYPISPQGIGSPVISSIGSVHNSTIAEHGQGYMEVGTPNRIAVALSTPGVSNVIEVFDFIDSTGVVTNFRTADLESTTGQVYGIEISAGGNKLYATLSDPSGSQIVEFAFNPAGMPRLKNRTTFPGELGAMQVGPDGQIYVAINGSSSLGTFQAVEDTTQITPLPVPLQPFQLLGGTESRLGLPNFIQIIASPTQSPSISFVGACLGDSTTFTASGKDPVIDKFDWIIVNIAGVPNGQRFNDHGPEFKFPFPIGTHQVNVIIYNKCEEVATLTQVFEVTDIPPDPFRDVDVSLCSGPEIVDANPQDIPDFTYQWSTGETTETITVDQAGPFSVIVTDSKGCTRTADFFAGDNRPQVDFGPDQAICEGAVIPDLDAGALLPATGVTYEWELNGGPAPSPNSPTQSVDTSTPGTRTYSVRVVDTGTGFPCETTEEITFVINDTPGVTVQLPLDEPTCGNSDGSITFTIDDPNDGVFEYIVSGPNTTPVQEQDQSADTPITATSLPGGSYSITVTEQVTGCQVVEVVNLDNADFTVSAVQDGNCIANIGLLVDASGTPGASTPVSYRVIDQGNGQVILSDNNASNSFTTAVGLLTNQRSYVVEVTDNNGCVASSDPAVITENAAVTVTFDETNICTTQELTAIAGGATPNSFTWSSAPTGAISAGANTATVTLNPGTWDMTVLVTDSGPLCPGTGAITVTIPTPITPTLTQSDQCADAVDVIVNPIGNYQYRWFLNGSPIQAGTQISGVTDPTQVYRLDIFDPTSGCVFNGTDFTPVISGDFSVSVIPTTLPCEGTPFTLEATMAPPTGAFTFLWRQDGKILNNETGQTLSATEEGAYTVTVTRDGACQELGTFNVGLLPITPGSLVSMGIICPDPANPDPSTREVELDPGSNFISYEWFHEGQALGVTTQTYTATEPGLYTVNLVNEYNCPSTDQTELFEECNPKIVGPNVFRPGSQVSEGGENINQTFRLFTFFIADEDFHIFIFNRWGEMVFESADRNFRWNGGYKNNPSQLLPPGTYSYVVKYRSSYREEDGIMEKRGGVVLLR